MDADTIFAIIVGILSIGGIVYWLRSGMIDEELYYRQD